MNKSIYRFYGCSGTFKGTTISNLMRGVRLGYCIPIFSPIKPWKRHFGPSGVLNATMYGTAQCCENLDLAGLSLVTLEQGLWQANLDPDLNTIFAERGVLDNLFYWVKRYNFNPEENKTFINKVRGEELELESKYGFKEEKSTILVMEDEEFIEKEILKEPTRREWFPTVADYLKFQTEYIEFIKNWLGNKSPLYLRRINSAPIYLEKIKKGEVYPSEKIN